MTALALKRGLNAAASPVALADQIELRPIDRLSPNECNPRTLMNAADESWEQIASARKPALKRRRR
jgi:hypothetical protein